MRPGHLNVQSITQQDDKLLFVERTLALPSGEGGRAPARPGEVSWVKAYQQPTFDTPSGGAKGTLQTTIYRDVIGKLIRITYIELSTSSSIRII